MTNQFDDNGKPPSADNQKQPTSYARPQPQGYSSQGYSSQGYASSNAYRSAPSGYNNQGGYNPNGFQGPRGPRPQKPPYRPRPQPGTRPNFKPQAPKDSMQNLYLKELKEANMTITLNLQNGVELVGTITDYDNFCIRFQTADFKTIVYKHALSAIFEGVHKMTTIPIIPKKTKKTAEPVSSEQPTAA